MVNSTPKTASFDAVLSVLFTRILVTEHSRDLFLPTISICSLSGYELLPEHSWWLRVAQGSAHSSLRMLRVGIQACRHVFTFMLSDCSRQLQKKERTFVIRYARLKSTL
jgi:hypothetical protein